MGDLLSIIVDEADLENRTNQWISGIIIFNNEHIIQHYNIPQSNMPKELRYVSCMIPTGFINVQYE